MVADGLTKGSIDRTLLRSVMKGSFDLNYAVHEYREPTEGGTTGAGGPIGEGGVSAATIGLAGHPISARSKGRDSRQHLFRYRE